MIHVPRKTRQRKLDWRKDVNHIFIFVFVILHIRFVVYNWNVLVKRHKKSGGLSISSDACSENRSNYKIFSCDVCTFYVYFYCEEDQYTKGNELSSFGHFSQLSCWHLLFVSTHASRLIAVYSLISGISQWQTNYI